LSLNSFSAFPLGLLVFLLTFSASPSSICIASPSGPLPLGLYSPRSLFPNSPLLHLFRRETSLSEFFHVEIGSIPQSLNEMTNEIVDCLVHLCHWGLRHLLRLIKVSSSASVYASSSADPNTAKSNGTYLDSALTMKAYIRLITSYMNKINTINGPKSNWNWRKTYYNNCESLVMVAQVQLKSFHFGYGNPIYLASTPKLL
jgi:hypothetical protein